MTNIKPSIIKSIDNTQADWKLVLNKMEQCPQRQDGTLDQLKDLISVANKLGFYDAADFLKGLK